VGTPTTEMGRYAEDLAQTIGDVITLNTTVLKYASKELIALTIIHEMLHVYIGKDELTDHTKTSEKYVKPMADYLNAIFGINKGIAESMVWDGLGDTLAYGQRTEQENWNSQNYVRLYKNLNNFDHGQTGTHCLE
jgi:hypothetical protein